MKRKDTLMQGDTENPTCQDLKHYRQAKAARAPKITITIPVEEVNTVADLLYMTWLKIGLNEPGKTELKHILMQLDTLEDHPTPRHE